MPRDASPRPRRPRAVADAPVEALAARAEGIAKGWMLALLDSAPIEAAAALPAAAFAREAPLLCTGVARALASEPALNRLRDGGDLADLARRAGSLTGATDPAAATAAVASLRSVIWAATTAALDDGDEDLVAPLAERLAHVCDVVGAAAVAGLAEAEAEAEATPAAVSASASASAPSSLDRALNLGEPFALLLLEIDGADRLPVTEGVEAAGDVLARAANAVRAVLGEDDLVVEESPGRLLLLLSGSGRLAALAQAERVAAAVERATAVRGAPLTASVGVALHPTDGADRDALAAQAEQSLYAARAAGVRVGGREPEARSGPRLVR
jgi:GGDEF domain-containing protein